MDTNTLLKYLAFSLTTYFTLKHIFLRTKVIGKNLPPSPFPCFPIIGHLYLFKKPLHRSLAHAAARYGSILYLKFGARPVILLSSPSAVEEALVGNDVFVDRPHLLPGKYGGYDYTSIVWAPYGAHWRNQRRITAVEILSSQPLQVMYGFRASVARSFIRRVIKESSKKAIVDMKSAICGLVLDNVMRMLVGSTSCKFEEEEVVTLEAFKSFQVVMEKNLRLGGVSNIEDFLPIVKWFWSAEETLKKLKEQRDEFMDMLMKEHREMEREGRLSEGRKTSMLHALLSLQKQDAQYYSDEMIRGLISTLFQAATDTSAATIEWALSLLFNHPEVMKKAQAEIDANVGSTRLVEESDKNNLPYVQCIIDETLRMFPTGPLGLPYESNRDCQIGNYHVPKGSILLCNIWAIHNDPKIWEEPRKFKPERFLGVNEATNKQGSKFMPFGIGRRVCPGEHLARRMVWLAVAISVQCFAWERISKDLLDMSEGGGLTMFKLEPLQAKCCPRPCMMDVFSQL